MQKGDRVQLVRCSDPFTTLKAGDQGEVIMVDSLGTIHVKWDNGSTLGIAPAAGDSVIPAVDVKQ